ncbi:MAG: acyltransferase [Cyclobacteriaceae bacterium]|nr:acyltransferase [Cyclobacteriaceae bacterium]
MSVKKVYFPNINGLRFIAALLVIIHHTEQIKDILGLSNYWSTPIIRSIGGLGVLLFFVLSGFLITFLLLDEESTTGTMSIKKFYIRRILRIWPLYYLILILGFFVYPHIPFLRMGDLGGNIFVEFKTKFLLFLFILPNLALSRYSPIPYISQSWSIGVEEQFYLMWPLLMKNIKKKLVLFLFIILTYSLITIFLSFNTLTLGLPKGYWIVLKNFWSTFSINCMAIGAFFAFIVFKKYDLILKILYGKWMQIGTYCMLISMIIFGFIVPFITREVYAVLFGIVILNLATNNASILNMENKTLNYLGKISYGLYMFHPIVIVLVIKSFVLFGIASNVIYYPFIILFTIVISGFSYFLMESRFLKLKQGFSKILSGDSVKLQN